MDTTILFRVFNFYVLEFYTIFSSLTKIVAAWGSDSSPSVSLLASQATGTTAAPEASLGTTLGWKFSASTGVEQH